VTGHDPGVVRTALLIALAAVVAGGAQTGAASPVSAGLPDIVLKASQVGSGYELKMRSDSHCVQACVTLDLCGFTFKSEALRTGRLQVNYLKPHALDASNEVVRYRTGGAAKALSEVDRAVATCPKGPVSSTVRGVGPVTYRIHRLSGAHLLPGALALRIHVAGTANGRHFAGTTTAVYQRRGDVLSGVYISLGADATAAAQWRLALHAAQASARNLRATV
jgi:hypothetical protein